MLIEMDYLAKPSRSTAERSCRNTRWVETIGDEPSLAIEAGCPSSGIGIISKINVELVKF